MAYPPHGHVTLSSVLGQDRRGNVDDVVGLRVEDFDGRGAGGEVGFLVICAEPPRSQFPLFPLPPDAPFSVVGARFITMSKVGELVGVVVG